MDILSLHLHHPARGRKLVIASFVFRIYITFTVTSPRKGTETNGGWNGDSFPGTLHPHHPARGRKREGVADRVKLAEGSLH